MVKIISSNGKTFATDISDEVLVSMAISFLFKAKDFCDEMDKISKKVKDETDEAVIHKYRLEWRKLKAAAKVACMDYTMLKEEIEKREIVYDGPTLEIE